MVPLGDKAGTIKDPIICEEDGDSCFIYDLDKYASPDFFGKRVKVYSFNNQVYVMFAETRLDTEYDIPS